MFKYKVVLYNLFEMLHKLSDNLEIVNKDEIIEQLTNYKFRVNGSEPIEMNDI